MVRNISEIILTKTKPVKGAVIRELLLEERVVVEFMECNNCKSTVNCSVYSLYFRGDRLGSQLNPNSDVLTVKAKLAVVMSAPPDTLIYKESQTPYETNYATLRSGFMT